MTSLANDVDGAMILFVLDVRMVCIAVHGTAVALT